MAKALMITIASPIVLENANAAPGSYKVVPTGQPVVSALDGVEGQMPEDLAQLLVARFQAYVPEAAAPAPEPKTD
jgi:hypothetical protein